MKQKILESIADAIVRARKTGHMLRPWTSRPEGLSVADAYVVADIIHQRMLAQGAKPAGRKLGFTNPEMWALYGVSEPIWAYVYDTTVSHLSPPRHTFGLTDLPEPMLEPEIVLHFDRSPGPTPSVAEIIACIDWIAHGIEIVRSHYPNWDFSQADTIADGGLHAHLLVGPPLYVHDWLSQTKRQPAQFERELNDLEVRLKRNGVECASGSGDQVLGGPLPAIQHLSRLLADANQGPPLRSGELVTTGSLCPAQPIEAGDTWVSEINGLGLSGLEVTFCS